MFADTLDVLHDTTWFNLISKTRVAAPLLFTEQAFSTGVPWVLCVRQQAGEGVGGGGGDGSKLRMGSATWLRHKIREGSEVTTRMQNKLGGSKN